MIMLDDVMTKQSMLTTIDNPFDPFTQFDDWYAFDTEKGYDTCSYLARIAKTSDELSPVDEALAIELAIDEIVTLNVLGIYKKVVKDIQKTDIN
jgi:hypothetical protein